MARFSPVIYVTFSRQRSLVAPIARADSAGRYRPPTSRAPIALAGRHLDSLAVIRILPRPLVLALVALALATACHRGAPAVTRVAPLQLFGAEPDLMPALGFEPVAGVLTVSAQHPVFVTVVEVDPATQVRDVVFPETGATPLRVSGEMSLQLALQRRGAALPARGILVIASADSLVVPLSRQGGAPWSIPDEMPGAWAAVYVWTPSRLSAVGRGR